MPTGLSAAFAGCEALRAEQTADGNTQRVVAGAKCPATTIYYPFNTKGTGAIKFSPRMPGLGQGFCGANSAGNSKSEIRNNIEIQMFKILNSPKLICSVQIPLGLEH